MGELINPRHETFAQEIALGTPADAAYIKAGYKPNRGNAIRLKTNENVKKRVAELMGEGARRAAKTLDDVIAEYERIAFTGLSKFVHIDANGTPRIDLSNCTPEDLDLLGAVQTETFKKGGEEEGEVVKVRIQPIDRLKALEKLANYLGMGVNDPRDKVSMTAVVNFINVPPKQEVEVKSRTINHDDGYPS
ncbi:terminase small subunit [Roseobacter sp. AzwK-3b]|uniref:terminase small subunit n=1 Tax=Roseobacter sp. AzwK-3b TaxID=351016 RepID=UPI000682AFDA|nr:terminase small subunit [Roseobacter sp. AzwK-3b]